MSSSSRLALGTAACVVAIAATAILHAHAQQTTIRIGEADAITGEDLVQLIAYANAEKRGVEIEVLSLKSDDITFQAVLSGEIDVGVGAPYAAIQNLEAPIRHFYQVRRLAYFMVVNTEHYTSWEDLDGGEIAVHSRGSGTEALARVMANVHGIDYDQITYVPGSEVRAIGMRRGTITATYLDLTQTRLLMSEEPGRFAVLPGGERTASDSVLYAEQEFLENNAEAVQILVEELLKAARRVSADPTYAAEERERRGLLPDLPQELATEITPYFMQAAQAELFPTNGGAEGAVRADFEFHVTAGSLEGPVENLKPEDFWDMTALNDALAQLGTTEVTYTPPQG